MSSGVYKTLGMLMELKVIDTSYSSVSTKLILVLYWETVYTLYRGLNLCSNDISGKLTTIFQIP